jgi:uracil-DNA glycosylase family 4
MSLPALPLPALPRPPIPPARLRVLPSLHQQLLADGAQCHRCPLSRNGLPSRPVATEWIGQNQSAAPAVAIVGEAPGRRETQTGRPFVGVSGKLLDFACAKAGIPRGGLAILNGAACGPIPSDNDSMKQAALAACRPRLLNELRHLQPRVIMAVGSHALRSLSPEGTPGVTALRGALLPLAEDVAGTTAAFNDRKTSSWRPAFFSTFHPAHILRGGDGEQKSDGNESRSVDLLFYFFLYDLAKAWRFAHGQAKPWVDAGDLFVMTDAGLRRVGTLDDGSVGLGDTATAREFVEAIERVHEEAKTVGEHASDVETDGKDAVTAGLTAIASSTVHGGVAATWRAFLQTPNALRAIQRLHADPSFVHTFHFKIFDTVVLPRHGIPILGPIGCTVLKHHAAFPGLPHTLEAVATQFFITPPWKAEFRRSEKNEAELVLYCYRDGHAAAYLSPILDKMLEAHRTGRVYIADRQQFSVATQMRRVGYFVDRKEQARHSAMQRARLNYMRSALEREFKALEERWRQTLARQLAQKQRKKDPVSYLERVALRYKEIAERDKKPTDVGLLKTKAKADLVALFEVLRIPIAKYTKKGAPVTDKDAMEKAAARHPLMRRLIHIREAQHLIATYIDGLPVKPDGRVHPDWSPKITGRWGAGKAQNWPNFVVGWPPEMGEGGHYKVTPSGDLVCPRENPRSIVAAPTAAEIIDLYEQAIKKYGSLAAAEAAGGYFPFAIYVRAKVFGRGRVLVGADFEQLELRIAAYLARDPFLLHIFENGLDPHSVFARECFADHFPKLEKEIAELGFKPKSDLADEIKELTALLVDKGWSGPHPTNPGVGDFVPPDGLDDITRMRLKKARERLELLTKVNKLQKHWKRLRDLSKRAEYGGIYGGEAESLHAAMVKDFPELTIDGLRRVLAVINEKMAAVVRWRNGQEAGAHRTREVREALLGRVRLFPLGNFNPNIVYNFPIQAFAASLLAKAIFRFVALTRPDLLQLEELYRWGLLDAAWVQARRAEGFDQWNGPVELILNGHDSLVAEADDEDGAKAAKLLALAMTQELPMNDNRKMVFLAKAVAKRRWSEAA